MFNLATLFLPLAIEIVRSYIKNSDTKKDDQILQVVQEGCYYLVPNKNNDMNIETADIVATHTMIGGTK